MRRSLGALAPALLLLLAACGGDDDQVDAADPPTSTAPTASTTPPTYEGEPSLPDPGGTSSPPAVGPMDVAAALGEDDGLRVIVTGHLIALPDGTAELCGGPIQESAPPRCGDPALPVDGLDDPASVFGTNDVGGWVEGDVTLIGVLDGGRLDVS